MYSKKLTLNYLQTEPPVKKRRDEERSEKRRESAWDRKVDKVCVTDNHRSIYNKLN